MLSFFTIHPKIKPPQKADKSALGKLPLSAFQYCEALRIASALGWYVFSPSEFSINFDGKEVFIADDGAWRPLYSEPFPFEMETIWRDTFETQFGPLPSWLTVLPDTGVVQIFTGIFVSTTSKTWSHIRPLININNTNSYWCYEGIVETDKFSPSPLFINIQLTRTDSEIFFSSEIPLFQVCCLPKAICDINKSAFVGSINHPSLPKDGLLKTLRRQPGIKVSPGQYGSEARKRKKSGLD